MEYTSNYNLRKPGYGDSADIADINWNTTEIDRLLYRNRSIEGNPYDTAITYNTGDLVIYEHALYRCLEDGVTGAWNASKWAETDLATEVASKGEGSAVVTKEASGNPVTFGDAADAPLVECKASISAKQDLHGYSKPWVGGGGKNKLPLTVDGIKSANTSGTWSGNTYTLNGVTFTIETDGDDNVTGIKVNGIATADIIFVCGHYTLKAGSSIKYSGSVNGAANTFWITYHGYPKAPDGDGTADRTSASTDWDGGLEIGINNGTSLSNQMFKPMIRLSTVTDFTFEPYSNLCPIEGMDEVNVTVADDDTDPTVEHTYTLSLGSTRYGGELDVVRGVFRGTHGYADLGALTWYHDNIWWQTTINDIKYVSINTKIGNAISDGYIIRQAQGMSVSVAGQFAIDVSNLKFNNGSNSVSPTGQLVYELATPTEITLTAEQIRSLQGSNTITTDADTLDLEYITEDYQGLVDIIERASGSTGHTYSTSEQVVGKWIDGSDLYEGWVTITNQSITGGSVDYKYKGDIMLHTLIPDSDYVAVDFTHSYYQLNDNKYSFIGGRVDQYTGEVVVVTLFSASNVDIHLLCQYTKATATRSLSKGTTTDLKADLSGEKQELDEISTDEETSLKKANTEEQNEDNTETEITSDAGEQTDES